MLNLQMTFISELRLTFNFFASTEKIVVVVILKKIMNSVVTNTAMK